MKTLTTITTNGRDWTIKEAHDGTRLALVSDDGSYVLYSDLIDQVAAAEARAESPETLELVEIH